MWFDEWIRVPEDDNEVFVGNYENESIDEQKFKVFLTSERLIKFSLETYYIFSDATYKLTYGGFPVLTAGTTDKSKIFHPFGLTLCSTEQSVDFAFFFRSVRQTAFRFYSVQIKPTTLVADNADAITNGEIDIFIEYFINQWGARNQEWYEGYYNGIPSTTNGLESSHDKIKKAFRGKRLGL